jgi:hypothetical protein
MERAVADLAADAGLTSLEDALEMSWERLNAIAAARRRVEAERMLMILVAAQGNPESWNALRDRLKRLLND